jgi:murein DD-endopeptidase MepM/ murein hydrolase activator NlpD
MLALLLGLWALTSTGERTAPAQNAPASPPPPPTPEEEDMPDIELEEGEDEWVHPLPALVIDGRTYEPTQSDGFQAVATDKHRKHMGSDLDYRRDAALGNKYPKLPDGTKHYFFPPNVPVHAARAGRVWAAKKGTRGHFVVLVHDSGHRATFYQHLASLDVKKGQTVAQGDVIGTAGYDVGAGRYPFRHLHFERWDWSGSLRKWVKHDPWPEVQTWPVAFTYDV